MNFENLYTWFIYIIQGAGVTLQVYFGTLLFSIPLGALFAIGKLSRFKLLKVILGTYTWIIRGTPLMLQLMFVYYGLPIMAMGTSFHEAFTFGSLPAALITFVINYSAYFTEIFRGGIQSINKGQYEAAQALGMTPWVTMKRVVLPQAVKNIIPPLGNEAITLIKDTALCFVIALPEILENAKSIVSRESDTTAYAIAAVVYLAMTFIIIQIFRKVESRFAYY
jgi:polar amino acid transport system permease protein